MSKLVSRVAAIAALALAATPIIGLTAAHAAESPAPVARIPVGDLTLSDPADARQFARRIDLAAREVCDSYGNKAIAARACVADFKSEVKDALSEKQIADLRTANRAGAKITLAAY
ncbi:UrcA family protein [uncultured Caulobacter sp.]|uniref:UrcA family protein n=1 Tax=uncultured Caulobacter sp. TaxID=158749 RepID=UPI002612D9F7|nr:UrcA family protein [uncultured Caulobacter sp.]